MRKRSTDRECSRGLYHASNAIGQSEECHRHCGQVRGTSDSGDSTQIVLIAHQKVSALCFMTKFRAALAEQANITRMAERSGDDRSIAYAYASQILVSSAAAPRRRLKTKRRLSEVRSRLLRGPRTLTFGAWFAGSSLLMNSARRKDEDRAGDR